MKAHEIEGLLIALAIIGGIWFLIGFAGSKLSKRPYDEDKSLKSGFQFMGGFFVVAILIAIAGFVWFVISGDAFR